MPRTEHIRQPVSGRLKLDEIEKFQNQGWRAIAVGVGTRSWRSRADRSPGPNRRPAIRPSRGPGFLRAGRRPE